jgi:hypothetical protein
VFQVKQTAAKDQRVAAEGTTPEIGKIDGVEGLSFGEADLLKSIVGELFGGDG